MNRLFLPWGLLLACRFSGNTALVKLKYLWVWANDFSVSRTLPYSKKYHPEIGVGGFHLYNPINKRTVPASVLDETARELAAYQDMQFFTCHYMGKETFLVLSQTLPHFLDLSCGEIIQA